MKMFKIKFWGGKGRYVGANDLTENNIQVTCSHLSKAWLGKFSSTLLEVLLKLLELLVSVKLRFSVGFIFQKIRCPIRYVEVMAITLYGR